MRTTIHRVPRGAVPAICPKETSYGAVAVSSTVAGGVEK
jgi:hypothetical protein